MIIAVTSILNEADIIIETIDHLFNQGIDHIVISDGGSTDSTPEIIDSIFTDITLIPQSGPFDQGAEITRLAHLALDQGASWVLPFDADEFWIDPLGTTVEQVLNAVPDSTTQVYAATYPHITRELRGPQKPLSKVCFRPHPNMVVAWGNHSVSGIPGESLHGVLEIRELQYRSLDHFIAKVEKARQLFNSWEVPVVHGHHMRLLVAMTPSQLEESYNKYLSIPTEHNPIP